MPGSWTPVALSPDLPPGVVVPARAEGTELAVWRSRSGRLAAWIDRCPHRGMRLSHGFVRGEALSCIYHGWSYGASGQCLRIPAHPDLLPPEAIRVPAFAAAEAGGVVWAAREAPEAPPPAFPGFVPLRSMTAEVAAERLAAEAGAAPAERRLRCALAGVAVRLLLQPLDAGRVQIHLLAAEATPAAGLKAASRAAEALRRRAEASAETA
jgi:nitrite reductase/ring-hydroxylating ferredoxin subunit